jgi:hypothetical protein
MKMNCKHITYIKRVIVFNILLFSSLVSQAGFADKAKDALSREFNSFEGIWIMLGLIGGGLGLYVIMNQVQKKQAAKEAAQDAARGPVAHTHHHRRHKHKVAKKSS